MKPKGERETFSGEKRPSCVEESGLALLKGDQMVALTDKPFISGRKKTPPGRRRKKVGRETPA